MSDYYLHPSARLGEGCRIGKYSVIHAAARLAENVTLGSGVVVYPGTRLGAGVRVEDGAVIGRPPRPAATSTVKTDPHLPPAAVGPGAIIGTGAVIYAGVTLEEQVMVADLASVREQSRIGPFTIIGRGVAVENRVNIGAYVKIQTGAYITAYTVVEDYVFIAPMVTTTNDNYMGRTERRFAFVKGPTIRRGARVGGGAVLLPGVEIAPETFIAAGALVTRNTRPRTLYMGVPARAVRPVSAAELRENCGEEPREKE